MLSLTHVAVLVWLVSSPPSPPSPPSLSVCACVRACVHACVQYLMGAAFHRGADRDLGPIVHDHAGGHGDVHTRL